MSDRRSLIYFTLTTVYAVFLMIILLLPSDSLPVHKVFSVDKVWHFATYFLLALGLIFSFREGHWQIWYNRRWTLIISLVHAGVSEILQGFSPGRASDLSDWFANCLGIGLALLLLNIFPKFFEKSHNN
ncbi:MAG: VanZ family protein [Candidatus Marinimicrobia bacterium]|nr:VanZ family protein [Candidatus Neomarinimicrobiota bacterium]